MNQTTLSLVAFGLPSSATTFSGYARSLLIALRSAGVLRHEYSVKPRCWIDLLRSIRLTSPGTLRLRPHISRRWIWSEPGAELMSRRLDAELRRRGDTGAFLQVGTLVRIDPCHGPHYMLTDMTIPQARRAGHFAVSHLSRTQLDVAEAIQRRRLQEAQHVFALCQWTAHSLVHDCGVKPENISVVYAGSNLQLPEGVHEPRNPREILFVGIDWPRKGGPLLLKAFEIVHQKFPDAILTVVGCNPKIDQPGVRIEGYLSRSDPVQLERLARCFLRASCFCLPSVFDPFPNVLIEAASVGLPAVAIRNGSRAEVIVDGVTGRLVAAADPRELADALIELLSDPERLLQFGRQARERAQREFTWERVVGRILAATTEPGRGAAGRPGLDHTL